MLPKKLQTVEQSNKLVYSLGKIFRFCDFELKNKFADMMAYVRRHGYNDSRYMSIKKLENTHNGERCFVIATGPSLTLEDLESLKSEFTFGMNSLCLLYDKTTWRPSLYGIQDVEVYKKLEDVLKKNPENVFVCNELAKVMNTGKSFNMFPINNYYHSFDYRYTDKLHVKFSNNAYAIVYDAYSITFSLLQIAIYMGFKEIYLLGCDCNYEVGKNNHIVESGRVEDETKLRTAGDRMIFSHNQFKKYCEKLGVKVFNATRGGRLEVYPRVKLEQVLGK